MIYNKVQLWFKSTGIITLFWYFNGSPVSFAFTLMYFGYSLVSNHLFHSGGIGFSLIKNLDIIEQSVHFGVYNKVVDSWFGGYLLIWSGIQVFFCFWKMAQILAASPTCQLRVPKHSVITSSKLWSSVVLKQKKQSTKLGRFTVSALQSDNSTINRVETLLNLDTKPYTDRIIAEYIWYICFLSYEIGFYLFEIHVRPWCVFFSFFLC